MAETRRLHRRQAQCGQREGQGIHAQIGEDQGVQAVGGDGARDGLELGGIVVEGRVFARVEPAKGVALAGDQVGDAVGARVGLIGEGAKAPAVQRLEPARISRATEWRRKNADRKPIRKRPSGSGSGMEGVRANSGNRRATIPDTNRA